MNELWEFFSGPAVAAAKQWADWAFWLVIWAEALTAIGVAYATRMIPLRLMAILNNALGIVIGVGLMNPAIIVKHSVNFPLNARRMSQMRQLIAKVKEAGETDLNVEWLKPFMFPKGYEDGQAIFTKGETASEAFILVEGEVELPEIGVRLAVGEIFGEMALFTQKNERTASAVCRTDVRVLAITYEQFEQLYFQNPEFGLYLVRLIVQRYERNKQAHTAKSDA